MFLNNVHWSGGG